MARVGHSYMGTAPAFWARMSYESLSGGEYMAKAIMGIMTVALASWLAAILWVADMRMWALFVIVTAVRCTCYDIT